MSFYFNLEEILKMAVRIEENGAEFYKEHAANANNAKIKDLLVGLADMEVEHIETFSKWMKDLSKDDQRSLVFDPNNEGHLYLSALADERVFFKKEMGLNSPKEVINSAITTEKDSILFYLGFKNVMEKQEEKDKIDHIIHEEMSHIRLLKDILIEFY